MGADPPDQGRRGQRIGKYQILKHIATGGMGAVYKALDTDLRREVALKVLPADTASDPAALKRFRHEARHAAQMRHDNVVTIYEIGEVEGTWYIALELVEGINLFQYIQKKGRIAPEEARRITIQAALALNHAHNHDIVHRDIKPSNFLVTRKNDQMLIKLSDFGLAREARGDEARVTRSGTTVGTVDYISPEQARDSGSADIRSDIYSLGCTLYHMLTGQPPFPDGSLTERIYKHVGEEPADIRVVNPKVPDVLAAVVRRMMAKKPEARYQTPAELLKDLMQLDMSARPDTGRDVLAGLAVADGEAVPEDNGRPVNDTDEEHPAAPPSRNLAEAKPKADPELARKKLKVAWGAAAGCVVVVVAVTIALVTDDDEPARPTQPGTQQPGPSFGPVPVVQKKAEPTPPKEPDKPKEADPGPARPLVTRLYEPSRPLDVAQLQPEFEGPFAKAPEVPADAPVLRVSRVCAPAADKPTSEFPSLAAACAAAAPDRLTVIEVHDNGPLYEPAIAVRGKKLVIRAGAGWRPLIVWDAQHKVVPAREPDKPGGAELTTTPRGTAAFLVVEQGSLMLGNLDIVLRWAGAPDEPAQLVRVSDGDLLAWGCGFSTSGKHAGGAAAVRFEGGDKGGQKCRLSSCVVRGSALAALDLTAPDAEVLCDGSLLVGGDRPLLRVSGPATARPATLRLVRSTLVAGKTALEVQPSGGPPALKWMSWDVLLARAGLDAGGVMVSLPADAGPERMQWKAVNCLYAGWKTLLSGAAPVAGRDHAGWQQRWKLPEGDAAIADPWRGALRTDLAEAVPAAYQTEGTPLAYLATFGEGLLGCPVPRLPPLRESWLALTYERFSLLPVELLGEGGAPEIPDAKDGKYHGEKLDLNTVDLGEHLKRVQKSKELAPWVILHLRGSGVRRCSPVQVKNASLMLYFEPPAEKAEPLVLEITSTTSPAPDGFIEVLGGHLAIAGGDIRSPDFGTALVPHYLVLARGGDLFLRGCRLQGPLSRVPQSFWGVLRVDGSGYTERENCRGCSIDQCVLLSGRLGIHVAGVGARVHVQHSLLVAAGDALHFQPGPQAGPRLNVSCSLEHNTIAPRRALLYLEDGPPGLVPAEPIIVQSRGNAFINPFLTDAKAPSPAGLLLYEGSAFSRGLLAWQGEGDAYDERLRFAVLADGAAPPEHSQPHQVWTHLWGPQGDRQPLLKLPFKQALDLEKPLLDRLAVPAGSARVGADLMRLGIVKKAKS